MSRDLSHEQRCSCEHLAFQHARPTPHACAEAGCPCEAFALQPEMGLFDLLD